MKRRRKRNQKRRAKARKAKPVLIVFDAWMRLPPPAPPGFSITV